MKPTITHIGGHDLSKAEGDWHHMHYDNLAELHGVLLDPEQHPSKVEGCMGKVGGNLDSVRNEPRRDWDNNAGWDGSVEMSFTGWKKGGDKVTDAISLITDYMPQAKGLGMTNDIDFAMSDEGEELCIDSYLDGDDMYWRQPVFQREKPIIRLCVNCSASAGISAQTIEARGFVIASLVCKLERIGYGVQLYVAEAGTNGGKRLANTVMVKDSCEYMHEAGLAFWLAHPACLRRIFFRIIELAPHATGDMGCCYGMPASFKSPDFDFISDEAHLSRAESEGWYNNPKEASKAAVEMIERIVKRKQGELVA